MTAPDSTMTLSVDDATIVVTVRPHHGPKALVYFGGNAEDVSLNLVWYTEAFPAHALYFLHYRGYGGSTGRPSETDNIADAQALVAQVRAQHPEVALVGRSLGSGVAIQVAGRLVVDRLVLITPFDSIVGIAEKRYPFVPVRWLARDPYESSRFAPRITTPTTIIAAADDEVIPAASTAQLLSRFKPAVATMTSLAGVGHNALGRNPQHGELLRAALR